MEIDDELLSLIADKPHILGNMIGMPDLTEMHSEWIKWSYLSPETTMLMAHRGSMKTSALVEIGILWYLLFHPNETIMLVRQNLTAAADGLKAIGKLYKDPFVRALYTYAHGVPPNIISEAYGKLNMSFQNNVSKEPTIIAQGIDSIRTGSHVSIAVCDDVVSREDRVSRASREATKLGMYELTSNIINPNKTTGKRKAVIIGTPWSPEDFYAEAESKRGLEIRRYDVYTTKLLTEEQINDCREKTTPSLFAANYELRHAADEDMIFTDPRFTPWLRDVRQVVGHLDPAYGGEDTGALTLMAERSDGKIQVRGWVFKEHVKDKLSWIKTICQNYKVTKLYLETNGDNGFLCDKLSMQDEHGPGLHTYPYRENMNKFLKISQYGKEFWNRFVFDTDMLDDSGIDKKGYNYPTYMEQVCGFTEITKLYDDAPDSMASLVREHFSSKAITQKTLILYGAYN